MGTQPDSETSEPIVMTRALEWAYAQAVNGVPGLGSAFDLVEEYDQKGVSFESNALGLVTWQCAKAGAAGFVSGIGGLLLLPATIPANLATVLFIQMRMILGIAHLAGLDIRDESVKTLVFLCLISRSPEEVFKALGVEEGASFPMASIKQVPGRVFLMANKQVAYRLGVKFAERGVVNISRFVPILGGLVGLSVDTLYTRKVGEVATKTFGLLRTAD